MFTVGVEEEYLLLDRATGLPVPRAEEVRAAGELGPFAEQRELHSELLQAQVEAATPVATPISGVGTATWTCMPLMSCSSTSCGA
ncbi:hypothetical protein ABZY36_03230 [Streptomyces sp. NPDC006627]|uniref:hypothetical protein n=1 Tax=Streptomyces sp. NPDC006627 TaxID=3154679 RepID=UPI0033A1F4CE